MHVEPRFAAFHLYPVLGPDSGLQINVRLVLFRSLLPRLGEAEIRMRTVLRRVIPPHLVVGSAVGGSQINVLVTSIVLKPESDADETPRGAVCAGGWLPGQIHFDRAIPK